MFWRWLYRVVMNRRSIGPKFVADMTCQVPDCSREAVEAWMPSVCALREAGIKIDRVHVCAEHDVQMNEDAVRGAFGDKYDAELLAYRNRRLANA